MPELPTLATEIDLRELLDVTDRTVREWKTNGLSPVGSYLPSGSKTAVDLYSVDQARTMRRPVADHAPTEGN